LRAIAYILLLIAAGLGIIGLVMFLKSEDEKRVSVLNSLEKARKVKADKKKADDGDFIADIEREINYTENLKKDASTKEKTD
jgi:hypothetical protein